jgi:hypothetical protein
MRRARPKKLDLDQLELRTFPEPANSQVLRQINPAESSRLHIAGMLKPAPSIKAETVLCPSCNAPMTLVRVTPRLGGMAELHTFECKACSAVLTEVADDRLSSGAYRGLL